MAVKPEHAKYISPEQLPESAFLLDVSRESSHAPQPRFIVKQLLLASETGASAQNMTDRLRNLPCIGPEGGCYEISSL